MRVLLLVLVACTSSSAGPNPQLEADRLWEKCVALTKGLAGSSETNRPTLELALQDTKILLRLGPVPTALKQNPLAEGCDYGP